MLDAFAPGHLKAIVKHHVKRLTKTAWVCILGYRYSGCFIFSCNCCRFAAYYKGVKRMATKSVLKTINIKDKKSALLLVQALENASGRFSKPVVKDRAFSDASREDIRKMFGDCK